MSGTSGSVKMEIDITRRLDDSAKLKLAITPQRTIDTPVRLVVVSFNFTVPDSASNSF